MSKRRRKITLPPLTEAEAKALYDMIETVLFTDAFVRPCELRGKRWQKAAAGAFAKIDDALAGRA